MLNDLEQSLRKLKGCSVQVTGNDACPPENGATSVVILFSNGTTLRADYWRVIKDGRASISNFDHGQQYGLPAPIDAVALLATDLQGRLVTDAQHDKETGDLLFWFTNDMKCQILNFTGYEIWEINFPDGTGNIQIMPSEPVLGATKAAERFDPETFTVTDWGFAIAGVVDCS